MTAQSTLTIGAARIARVLPYFAVLLLVGCAVPSSGVIPLSDGLHKVTHQSNGGAFVRTETLKAEAIKEADAYCKANRRQVRVIDVKQTEARPLGGWPEAEVLFKCEGATPAAEPKASPSSPASNWIRS